MSEEFLIALIAAMITRAERLAADARSEAARETDPMIWQARHAALERARAADRTVEALVKACKEG